MIYRSTLDVVVFQNCGESLLLLVNLLADLVPRAVGEIYNLLGAIEVAPRFLQDISATRRRNEQRVKCRLVKTIRATTKTRTSTGYSLVPLRRSIRLFVQVSNAYVR